VALARAAAPLMEDGGSIITMTYYGAERVVPRYNVMGVAKAALECSVRYLAYDLGKRRIRVNAISAGPIKTLAARGIADFSDMLKAHAERAPLQRNVDVTEVGSTGVFLASTPVLGLPARSSTSTAVTTSWAFRFLCGEGGRPSRQPARLRRYRFRFLPKSLRSISG